ncbi:MAG: hypothetical protein HY961_13015 [Ignavibacteriae bacterium]|nr:hypothetical protein [Ignavibacteriota bacterium]
MISRTEFEQSLSTESVRTSQIIHIALALGALLFFGVVIFLYFNGTADAEPEEDVIQALCLVLIVFGMTAYGAAMFVYKKMFAEISLAEPVMTSDGKTIVNQAEIFVARLRSAQIIRLALFQGVALFGLVICQLSVMNGLMHASPVYWAAALPTLFVILLVALTFPTKEKLAADFELYRETHNG